MALLGGLGKGLGLRVYGLGFMCSDFVVGICSRFLVTGSAKVEG